MSIKKQFKNLLESAAITTAVIIINSILRPLDPGFAELSYMPYILTVLFSAVYFRRRCGFFTLAYSAAAITLLGITNSNVTPPEILRRDLIILVIVLILVYIFGTIREIDRLKIENTYKHLKKATKEHYRIKKLSAAQLEINRELEERISGQRTTVNTLYSQMHKMDSLNLDRSLAVLLETVKIFTDATDVTIWAASPTAGFLYSPAAMHNSGTFDSSELLSIEGSIEGWVYRNNRNVSARTINNYEYLKKMDEGRNLITLPIPLNKKVWGVLNIEALPFIKYNQHTERLLEIIISLSEPVLARAVEHEQQITRSESDRDTNLPLFSQLYNALNRHIQASTEDQARMSLLIIEMQNFNELLEDYPATKIKKLFLQLTDEILLSTAGLAEFFMYKTDSQMAVLVPGIESDGASLLCLEILELINTTQWIVNNTEVFVEMIIGYSTLGENADDADGMIKHAEHLLEIQKI